jgi:hypothetical protein
MALSTEVLGRIDSFIRGGFEDRDRVIEILTEELYELGELDPDEVAGAVDAVMAEHEKQKVTWPRVTDCDRLNSVFVALSAKGIIVLQNAGYTQSDGMDDVSEVFHTHRNRESMIGYCFFHGQDLERAIDGRGLYLAFGPKDSKKEQTGGPLIGALITDELKHGGFTVQWNETFNQRIFIPAIDWKRR